MNRAQKAALVIGVGAIALMGIFPPWNLTFDYHSEGGRGSHSAKPAGYAPIYHPPKPPEAVYPVYTVSVDLSRLLIQWAIVAAVTGGLILILRSNTGDTSKNGPAKTNGNDPACQKRPEPAAAPAYPPIWSQVHTLPAGKAPLKPTSESERWPWSRVARWMYNWRSWLAVWSVFGGVSVLSDLGNLRVHFEHISGCTDMLPWVALIFVLRLGMVAGLVYAYATMFSNPCRAGQVLTAVLGVAIAGLGMVTIGRYASPDAYWTRGAQMQCWVMLAFGLVMIGFAQPLFRLRFAHLACLLNSLHRQGVPYSYMPRYDGGQYRGGCEAGSREPCERLSLWKLYRQVVIGKVILPEEADYYVHNGAGRRQGAR